MSQIGDYVIVTAQKNLGIARLERVLPDGRVRLFFYPSGDFWVGEKTEIEPSPVGFPMLTEEV